MEIMWFASAYHRGHVHSSPEINNVIGRCILLRYEKIAKATILLEEEAQFQGDRCILSFALFIDASFDS